MKLTLLSLILLLGFIGFSQNTLTQSTWYFTELVQGTTVTTQPILFRNVGTTLLFDTATSFETYAYNDINGDVTFDNNNTEFTLNFGTATLAFANDPVIDSFDQEYTQFFLAYPGQIFTYSVVTLGNITTLRITNPTGKVAVYRNLPLSETSFQLSSTDIFLSPSTDQILIDANEIPLNLLSYELFDLSGKKVLSAQKIENDQINISSLKNGFYIFKLKNNDGNVKTFKFSK
ncbi:putative secreted protein (Por secretion system target) [Nonlabens dokdonensis]|jgi:hypothetical protein|uniref:Secretion system C-terminal sorting domain-containing protein n=2 Tax=Nonlabens dokdonensis TaxID=328515 RepID=L7W7Q0_NONDD|nr:T9SS type A sorting domain-containing protein [Nonlabens dokdonensis]AGC77720.1 hypothetical protein DDD_2593 [Nonlabens dokdonensis DSW-6]PZX39743.1 putative secreted protein (Por secretion system target) [Nonlabens dokdonensis]